MGDAELLDQIRNEVKDIRERLILVEKEIRLIREDILSGRPKERMQRRLLENRQEKLSDKKEKIDEEIRIEI